MFVFPLRSRISNLKINESETRARVKEPCCRGCGTIGRNHAFRIVIKRGREKETERDREREREREKEEERDRTRKRD